jgi:hypothetical protein
MEYKASFHNTKLSGGEPDELADLRACTPIEDLLRDKYLSADYDIENVVKSYEYTILDEIAKKAFEDMPEQDEQTSIFAYRPDIDKRLEPFRNTNIKFTQFMLGSNGFEDAAETQETFEIDIHRENLRTGKITVEQSLVVEPPLAPKIEFKIYDNEALPEAMSAVTWIFQKTKENILVSRPSCLNPTLTAFKQSAYASVYRVMEVKDSLDNQRFKDYAQWMLTVGMHRIAEIVKFEEGDVSKLTSKNTMPFAIRLRNLMPHEMIFPVVNITSNNINELTVGIDFLLVIGLLQYNDGNKFITF